MVSLSNHEVRRTRAAQGAQVTVRVYMVRCSDASDYVGVAQIDLEQRINEHNAGKYEGYTFKRRPVELVWSEEFEQITDAIAFERQIKRWSRAKKEALIAGDRERLEQLARSRTAT
jgi:putative endonuclease